MLVLRATNAPGNVRPTGVSSRPPQPVKINRVSRYPLGLVKKLNARIFHQGESAVAVMEGIGVGFAVGAGEGVSGQE